MNPTQIEFILKHYRSRSVKEMAHDLGLDRKTVQRELRRLLAGQSGAARGPQERRASKPFPYWIHPLGVTLILALAFAVYAKSLTYPFMNWDDPQYVTENRLIRNFSAANLKEIFTRPHFSLYIPVTLVSYALDYQASHFNPFGYHLTNLLLHLANGVLVYTTVVLLTGDWLVALGAAAFFAVHPVQIESVVWIAERKNVLSSFFFLLGFLAYVLSRGGEAQSGKAKRRPGLWLFISSILFIFAVLAKPSTVVMPLILLAFDFSREHPGQEGFSWHLKGQNLIRYLPFFAAALAVSWITVGITGGEGKMNYHGGSLGATLLTMMVVAMKYFELLFCPLRQSLLYEFPVYPSLAHPQVGLSFLALAALAAVSFYLALRNRKFFFWVAWYVILLLPVLNLIPFPSLMNDRYLYLPLVGIFTLLLLILKRYTGAFMTAVLILAGVFGFTFLNLKRQVVWSHPETLWRETQAKTRQTHQSPYLNLGMHYLKEGQVDEAIQEFEKVLAIFEDPKAYDGLGIAYFKRGEYGKSIDYFKRAIGKMPEAAPLHSNLALVYQEQGDSESAMRELQEAVRLDPKEPKYRNNVGSLLIELGREEEAEAELLETLRIDPDFADGLYNLGLLYTTMGRDLEAEKHWRRLVELHPDHVRAEEVRERLGAEK